MPTKDFIIDKTGLIEESKNYFETKADSVVSVGTSIDGEDLVTFVFMNNYPMVSQQNGAIHMSGVEKKRVASITLSNIQAKKFYKSMESIFGDEDAEKK